MEMTKIDTLLMAARYLDEQDNEMKQLSPPVQLNHNHQHHQQQQQADNSQQPQQIHVHHVLQQQVPLQHVTIQPLPQQQPATIQNNNITTLTTQQVHTIRSIKKDLNVGSSPPQVQMNRLSVMNSFDIINPPVIDQGSGEVKRKQPPMAFRTGTREVHNKLEKNRRAHLKECFDVLYATLPNSKENKKTSNLNILGSAIKYISSLESQQRNCEQQMEMMAKEKIMLQQKLNNLKKEIFTMYNVDVSLLMPEIKSVVAEENVRLKVNAVSEASDYVKHRLDALTTISIKPDTKQEDIIVPSSQATQTTTTTATTGTATTLQSVAVVNHVLKLPKSITGALPVVATTANGIKEDTLQQQSTTPAATAASTTAAVQPTALSAVLPFGYQMNQSSLVVQKVIMSTSPQLTHFITTQPPLDGKVMPTIVNAQYVVKPLVVVSTPSRNS